MTGTRVVTLMNKASPAQTLATQKDTRQPQQQPQQQQPQQQPVGRTLRFSDDDRHTGGNSVPEEDTIRRWDGRPRTPCEISNDPDSFVDSALMTCNVTEYVCGEEPTVETPSLELSFNYDIYAGADVSTEDALAYVEEAIFREAAQAMGVDDCRMLFNGRKRLLRGMQSPSIPYEGFTGLIADPDDVLRSDGCNSSLDADELFGNEVCIPIVGGFTVYGESNNVGGAREQLLLFVEQRMGEGAFEVDSLISKVVFLGGNMPVLPDLPTTISPPPVPTTPEPSGSSGNDRLVGDTPPETVSGQGSGLTTGLVIAAGGLALVVLLAYYGISRQRRARKGQQEHRQRAVVAEVAVDDEDDDMFDVTDNSPTRGLAEKDSLALVPQKEMPGDITGGTDHDNDRTRDTDLLVDLRSFEESVYLEGSGDTAENKDSRYVHGQQSDGDDNVQVREVGSSEADDESYMFSGQQLSLIKESESQERTEDHNLAYELDGVSAASFDTRASARRLLQMT